MPTPPRCILLVDDDRDLRECLRALLANAGLAVVEAANGREALNYLTSRLRGPDLVVTNLAMPEMTGWELLKVMHVYRSLSSIPVLVVSGFDADHEVLRPLNISEYLRKPVDSDDFLEAVNRNLLRRQPPGA